MEEFEYNGARMSKPPTPGGQGTAKPTLAVEMDPSAPAPAESVETRTLTRCTRTNYLGFQTKINEQWSLGDVRGNDTAMQTNAIDDYGDSPRPGVL
jgi:hypothetical protein